MQNIGGRRVGMATERRGTSANKFKVVFLIGTLVHVLGASHEASRCRC